MLKETKEIMNLKQSTNISGVSGKVLKTGKVMNGEVIEQRVGVCFP